MAQKILRWFLFSVLIALLPFVWNWLNLITQQKNASFELLFSHGELLLVSCAISATALGELIGTGRSFEIVKIIVGFGCSVVLILNSMWFSQISWYVISKTTYDINFVTEGSLTVFSFSLLTALGSLILAEADR